MAITFVVSRCPKGFGVYVKSVSGKELKELREYMPEIDLGTIPVSFDIKTRDIVGGIAVKSGRLIRRNTVKECKKYVDKYCKSPQLIERLKKLYLVPINKAYILEKFQYFKLKGDGQRPINGDTTQDKKQAHDMLLKYSEFGYPVKLVKTVARNVKMTPEQHAQEIAIGETTLNIPQGMKGMMLPISKQRNKDSRKVPLAHLSGPRKRTQSLNFWKNK